MPNNFVCGWCGTTSPRSSVIQLDDILHPRSEGARVDWAVFQCAACERLTSFAPSYIPRFGDDLPEVFSPSVGRPEISLIHVPSHIAADYREALLCFKVGALKGAAVLARRAVETTANHLLGNEQLPQTLWSRIDLLRDKQELTARLARLAHKVRLFGNVGAHPGDDGLDTVTTQEAEEAIGFLEHLLQHVFIIDGGDTQEEAL